MTIQNVTPRVQIKVLLELPLYNQLVEIVKPHSQRENTTISAYIESLVQADMHNILKKEEDNK